MEIVSDQTQAEKRTSWLEQPLLNSLVVNWETVLFAVIMIAAVVTRFYNLEPRVMSHDENSHVYYSWRLYKGQGFAHDPLMHGPLQFHLLALSYFMFGDNDFTARIPAVLFSIASVLFVWKYRPYLGKIGALVAAALMVISPYMLFYGRYVRNEAFIMLFGVITLWAILRYIDTGKYKYIYWLTAAMVLHFTAKETSFIYMAQALLFLALYLIDRLARNPWKHPELRRYFFVALLVAVLFLAAAAGASLLAGEAAAPSGTETAAPAVPGAEGFPDAETASPNLFMPLAGLAGLAVVAAAVIAVRGYSMPRLRQERSFDLLMVMGTLVLPQLSAFPIFLLKWNLPTNAGDVMNLTTGDMLRIAAILVPLLLISIAIGLWWNRREWAINAAIWYGIFILFYTTVFTNGSGFFTGMVGSLGYWLEQQEVNRGNQPFYYYWGVQVPVYEYLPLLGTLLSFGLMALGVRWPPSLRDERKANLEVSPVDEWGEPAARPEQPPVTALLGFWVVSSMVAFTVAGEKMPWLTVHITLPMILLAGWGLGILIERVDWSHFRSRQGWLTLLVTLVFLVSLSSTLGSLLGATPPFQGQSLEQLRATSTFLFAFLMTLASSAGLFYLVRPWDWGQYGRVLTLTAFGGLALLTARTAFTASYINYDNANELLVYAHSAPGVKEALAQIEELSRRTSNGLGMTVAYDNETSYPYLWYLRNYTDARFYGADPTRSLREAAAILVGDANYGKIEPVVGQAYYQFDYIRLWWPNQDYFDLSWSRIWEAIRNPQMRNAVFQIWLNRDYTAYGQATGRDLSLPNWSPAARMRLYLRKDLANQIWNYGVQATSEQTVADPYEGKEVTVAADKILGGPGTAPGQFNRPRAVAVAQDGSLFVADTENHRIQHLAADGSVIAVWGSFGDVAAGSAAAGTFNQPWGIAVGPDGAVYVADVWNHRIQKFSPAGEFIKMWGYFGTAEAPEAFWGPRDVAFDSQGRLFVTDTGNKRVVIFDQEGSPLGQFGSAGMGPVQFDEPVGLAVDGNDLIYVADTWNQRIQVIGQVDEQDFAQVKEWEVAAWYGQSLDNKPYLAVQADGRLFATDPEGYRILQFDPQGQFVNFWGKPGSGAEAIGIAADVAIDPQGGVWVVDAGNSRVMHFNPPK